MSATPERTPGYDGADGEWDEYPPLDVKFVGLESGSFSKAKAEKNQAMEPSTGENSCQLCALGKITFEPPPLNCGPCGACIKRDAMYYTTFAGDTRHYFCIPCYNEACGDIIAVDGAAIPKAKLEKKKNDEEIEEWWIQCDKCEAWQHQICALFNGRRDDGGQAAYTCPKCYIQEVERGECNPLPQSAVLGAKDLPRTILSDHIEQRLFRKLKRERQERARIEGKSYDEVPGVEAPIVRVVSSIDKKLAVKQQCFEIFREENYPTEFPYKSKVILSFQKIEGVEVCIFAMYVQEFGSECAFPNQRCIYLSYLDSVKYFRPDIEAVTSQALSTFVYHEILIGYLEYCKKRGFTSCYIWACPPLKGEDNILHHLPEIQRMPKSDELRKWYLSMFRKAAMEGIVVDITNLYDHFFSSSECKAKITASKLPYFDGDYWPRAAEDLINQMHQEEDGKKQKGTTKESITERALKACGQSGLSANASKDLLLMHKIGEIICPMKEDFILVHLQHVCTYCRLPIVSGEVCWVCFQCENFQFCYRCYKAELKREESERHHVLVNSEEKHTFFVDKITDIPSDTKDKDKILESEFFDTRQAFLSLCQGNRYQFDTLRRAKHSTMMVLYHLHNPTTLSFVTRCNMCHLDIKTDQGWLCEHCPDYDVCNSCYQKNGGIDHPHELTSHPSLADRDAVNNKARETEAKAEKNLAMKHSMSDNSCQLCAVGKLTFEPPPVNCGPCGGCIKRDAIYYTTFAGDTRHYFCIPCYNEASGDTIAVDGVAIPKAKLETKKNDEETEEQWVQCDKCGAWQHQICALFNGRRNDGGQAAYTCPKCYRQEVERGECNPLPRSAVLGAKDLPRTVLSDHIEQRLFWKLKEERQGRARIERKSYNEVLGVETPIIRVVSSVDKKLEVRQRFFEIFQEENYPTEFLYKSKVILSFQNIEGVEICIFCMYVQEFGSECQFPNQRCVCLSYLDSVKYFSPEIEAVTGEALSTFVYHEILLGYLEHCKKRGFTSFYIRACPPLKDEDNILHCLPEIQRMPKPNELREWYISMLRKAVTESIVVDVTNLYDHFFVSNGECKAKVTAAILPYFDGDYWPSAAEDLIYQMHQEKDGKKQNEKRTTRSITKRTLQACGQSGLSTNALKDLLLMHKLGEAICPMKEDFILVHLQHACTYCRLPIVSGIRWVCIQCKNFQFCDRCYAAEQKREERERHHFLVSSVKRRKRSWENHTFCAVEITDVPSDTKDKDKIVECKFFDTRQAFLSLCQGNHYQFDTLRRVKHSSMMVLYHLHNPTAPAFVTRCNICQLDIKTGQGLLCTDYDVCNGCHHPHQLTNHPSIAARDAQNKEARQIRLSQLWKMLDVLVHASQCLSAFCQYPNCFTMKWLFCHGIQCKTHAFGGCVFCKKMWCLLRLHARACNESECHVPQCRCLKERLKRLQHLSDSRRKAVVMEMTRQRVAELSAMVVD